MARRRRLSKIKRHIRRLYTKESGFVALSVVALIGITVYGVLQTRTMINPTAYTPLLTLIAEGESRGNYNAYFGNASNQAIRFTDMTISEVLEWQRQFVEDGYPSNAVGRYQIIRPTLVGLVEELKLNTSEQFSPALQDRLAISLIERRGSVSFIKRELSTEEFAHNLSKEWAALPQIIGERPADSYYTGDGLNMALVEKKSVLQAIETFKTLAQATQ